MKEWPTDQSKTVMFSDLVEPLVDALNHLYEMKLREPITDVPYEGYTISDSLLACAFPPDLSLSAEQLEYDRNDQGREPMQIVLGVAVQLGMSQGERYFRERNKTWLLIMESSLKRLQDPGATERTKTFALQNIAQALSILKGES